jgi:hypothetical protein
MTSFYESLIIMNHLSRFTPSVPAIKKNIETLIEKEYVERSSKNRDVLNYLA